MNMFRNLRVGTKIGIGFGLLTFLMLILSAFSIWQLSKVNGSTVEIATNWLPSIRVLQELRYDASSVRRFELNHVLDGDKKTMDSDQENIVKNIAEVSEDLKSYEPMISSDEERHLYQSFQTEWVKYLAVQKRVLELSAQNKKGEAKDLTEDEGRTEFLATMKIVEDDVEL